MFQNSPRDSRSGTPGNRLEWGEIRRVNEDMIKPLDSARTEYIKRCPDHNRITRDQEEYFARI